MGWTDVNLLFDWPEVAAFLFLLLGFFLAFSAGNIYALYAVCFLMGLVFGRMWFKLKMSEPVVLFLIIMGFFLGFVLGGIWANLRAIAIILLVGIFVGYWVHKKKIIRTV